MTTIDASLRALEIQGTTVPKLGFGTWQIDRPRLPGGGRPTRWRSATGTSTPRGLRQRGRGRQGARRRPRPPQGVLPDHEDLARGVRARPTCAASAEGSLQNLQVDCLDLLLLHWPNAAFPLEETLGALAELRDDGLIKHFGVSNFPAGMLREALGLAPIFADQVEFHPFLGQDALVELAAEKDFMVTAYSPLARGKVPRDADDARDRRGARQDRRPDRAALAARQAQRLRDPEGLEPRAPGRELRGLRLRAQRRRAGERSRRCPRTSASSTRGWAPDWDA